jgi:hypothetical protein
MTRPHRYHGRIRDLKRGDQRHNAKTYLRLSRSHIVRYMGLSEMAHGAGREVPALYAVGRSGDVEAPVPDEQSLHSVELPLDDLQAVARAVPHPHRPVHGTVHTHQNDAADLAPSRDAPGKEQLRRHDESGHFVAVAFEHARALAFSRPHVRASSFLRCIFFFPPPPSSRICGNDMSCG